jgi:hypothetical protein
LPPVLPALPGVPEEHFTVGHRCGIRRHAHARRLFLPFVYPRRRTLATPARGWVGRQEGPNLICRETDQSMIWANCVGGVATGEQEYSFNAARRTPDQASAAQTDS